MSREGEGRMTGIIGAMRVEVDALKEKMENAVCETVSGVEFCRGMLGGCEVVLAQCGVGKVFAALCAQTMILRYGVDRIINTGVAGTLSENIGVLDVAVASAVVQHDMDTSPLGDPIGLISGINVVEIPTSKVLSEKIETAAKSLGKTVERGVIASGDQFINNAEKKAWIVGQFGAVACEMEGAAIGHVCYVNGVDFAVLRTISDNASGEADMEFPEMARRAAEQAQQIILRALA